ncbi:arylamine N-acetyltransferase family protein [Allosphingosinicella deserti]|uniref:Arylamine N-acetyltransferase n=1 Tax=Allosphingosinicella deserti TaxID=2116704 RepID=A0A2P7QYD8_9SPHN|nr:arylamine N-acetyltransferase [Sphingomonas deserti]PSJ42963.1 arylamine N-acetyltransferase [Sphingomonas deserti]
MTIIDPAAAPRILLVGRSRDVLDIVLQELRDAGLDVSGTADPESASEHFDPRAFDIAALGGGLLGPGGDAVRSALKAANPDLRLLDVTAPTATHRIMAELEQRGSPVDLEAYCARIGYSGSLTPTLETLRALHAHHIAAIPFEAIDALLDRPIDIAPASVDAKLIAGRRGGYCFEQNGLFQRVLAAMGFAVEGLIARVRWMLPPGAPPRPLTHMAMRVTIDGTPWLTDVGFGGNVLPTPIRLDIEGPQQTRHGPYRLVAFGPVTLLQARLGERWESLYDLQPLPAARSDYEVGNWFTSRHPSSHFRHQLIAAKTTPEARYNLLEGRLTVRRPGAPAEQSHLDAMGIEAVLEGTFGLPVEQSWRPIIERAASVTA